MTDVLWPVDLCPSQQSWRILGNTAAFNSTFTNVARTYSRPGTLMGCTMTWPMMRGADRARAIAALARLKDQGNRFWVPDYSTTLRGSFPDDELLTNNDFSNGATGWEGWNSISTLSVADRVARATLGAAGSCGINNISAVALSQGVPYAARAFISGGNAGAGMVILGTGKGSPTGGALQALSGFGMATVAVAPSAAGNYYVYSGDQGVAGAMAGQYMDTSYVSLSRCALVDGGGNRLLYSDQIDNAAWTKSEATVSANAGTAPDGASTADALIASTNSAAHYAQQAATVSSAEADYCISGAFRSNGYDFVLLSMEESTGSSVCEQMFNLNTGAVGTSSSTGAGWSNRRAFVVNMGGGWYYCCLIARKTTAGTTLTARAYTFSSDNSSNFVGDGSSGLYAWRVGLFQSSVPVRLTQSTSTAVSAASQTGSGIYVKGLPANTDGLLEIGDPVSIGGQRNVVTARLNSDASGRGYLQCGNPWRAATNDAPVVVNTPMCRMMLASDIDIDTGPGQFSPFQIELVEAID